MFRNPDPSPDAPDPREVARATQETIIIALRAGCLWGLGLVLLFFVISGIAYVLTGFMLLDESIRLLITFSCGPILGTAIVIVVYYARAVKQQREYLEKSKFELQQDETTPWDAP